MSAGANKLDPWFTIIVGFIAGIIYCGTSVLIAKVRLDDPGDAVAGMYMLLVSWSSFAQMAQTT